MAFVNREEISRKINEIISDIRSEDPFDADATHTDALSLETMLTDNRFWSTFASEGAVTGARLYAINVLNDRRLGSILFSYKRFLG